MKGRFSAIILIIICSAALAKVGFRTVGAQFAPGIYIRPDGSVMMYPIDGPAPIKRDGDVYTLTADNGLTIMVQRSNIVLDGDGHIQASGYWRVGINVSIVSNITIREFNIQTSYPYRWDTGIYIVDCSSIKIANNTFSNNGIGIALNRSQNNVAKNNSFYNNDIGIRVLGGCYGTVVAENSFSESRFAVLLEGDCDFSRIINNKIRGTHDTENRDHQGICVQGGLENRATDCGISGNVIVNAEVGIEMARSSGINVTNNIFESSGLMVWDYSYGNTVYNNTVNGMPLVYLENTTDQLVEEAGQVILVNCSRIRVKNTTLSHSACGAEILNTNSSIIAHNNVTGNNDWGIYVRGISTNNTFLQNIIQENEVGVMLDEGSWNNYVSENSIAKNSQDGVGTSDSGQNTLTGNNITLNGRNGLRLRPRDFSTDANVIYHNNFIDNAINQANVEVTCNADIWDIGYPSGGNYWGQNYTGTDLYRGVFQNETGSDGIGDTLYDMHYGQKDNYPLMNPWHDPPWSPVASFNWIPPQPCVNETTSFDARNSYDFDGQIANYFWDFGDGSTVNETNPTVNHAYAFPKAHNVTLTVTDNEGFSSSVTKSITTTKMNSTISIMSSPSAPILRQNANIHGSITPLRANANVTIQYEGPSHPAWAILANVATDEDGNYSCNWTPTQIGAYTFRANWTGDVYTFSSTTQRSVTCTKIPTSISILTNCTSSLNGFKVEAKGRLLEFYGTGLESKTIVFSYTFAGIGIWTPIASTATDYWGDYRLTWFPPATGYFMFKAEWAGNSTHLGTSNTIAVSTIPYDQYVFAVESNSTVTDLAFDSAGNKLSFVVDGENGTTGYTRVTIAKNLAPDITKLKVQVDKIEYGYTVTEMTDSWILTFTYNHSTHQIEVDFNQAPIPEIPALLVLPIFMIATLLAVIVYNRKRARAL
jgi:parallel beta-helix repeat protein